MTVWQTGQFKGYLERDSPPQPATTLLPLEKTAVFIDNKKLTTNVGPNVHYLLGAKKARRFYTSPVVLVQGVNKGGLGWTEERVNQVTWADLDRALHSKPDTNQLWLSKHFPCREKLIAPGMQRIEYAVVHKTRRSKSELHNKVDK